MKTLFMVRHATSCTNEGLHWNDGPASIPLTVGGHEQARRFAASWIVRPDKIIVSPYARSVQTALPLAEKFSLPLTTQNVQEFTYWDFKYSQPDTSEVNRRRQADNEFWLRLDPHEKQGGPNAESFAEFMDRCVAFRTSIERSDFRTCVCFSHGFFMHAFRAVMRGINLPTPQMMAHLHRTLPEAAYANLEVVEFPFHDEPGSLSDETFHGY